MAGNDLKDDMMADNSSKNSDDSVESPNKVLLNILPIRCIEEQPDENSDYFDSQENEQQEVRRNPRHA